MATRNPIAQAGPGAQFCDYCHQKPKFSNHSYCSKTCAAQAATLCNYCHKKPKFQNFDYCGKNCASQANPGGVKPGGGTRPSQGLNAQPKSFAGQRGQQQQQKPAFDPMQIAKLVAQQIPQVQALLGPSGLAALGQPQQQQQQPGPPPTNQYAHQPTPPVNRSVNSNPSNPVNNPFMNSMNPPPMPVSGSGHSNIGLATNGFQQQQQYQQPIDADDLECRIPGCGKPVHIDAKGLKTSDYCSQRHREEAVSSGLVSPCIMCLTRPQSHTDYFCGRTCREESLNKRYDPAEETRVEDDGEDETHLSDPNGKTNDGQILN